MKRNRSIRLLAYILMLSIVLTSCSSGMATSQATPSPVAINPAADPAAAAPIRYVNAGKYSIMYTVTIHNEGFSPSDIRLYLPMPVEFDAQKELVIKEISPEPRSQEIEKASGNAMLYWRLQGTPEKNTAEKFVLSFDLTAYETNTTIDPAAVHPYQKDGSEVKLYTKAEKYIESDDPKIAELADALTKEETNPYYMAKSFYDYIIDNMKYKLLGQGLNGAKYLLENKQGECGDYSALFIALCRAKGIPARPVVGYWAISGNEQTHVWAEFFLEGIGWIPVDATIGQQSDEKYRYYFGNMDNRRVILSKGYNTPLVPKGPDGYVALILQVPMWWFWGSGPADKLSMESEWSVSNIQ